MMIRERPDFFVSADVFLNMISWICFEWETSNLPSPEGSVSPLLVRAAEKSEEDSVHKTVASSFSMDSIWGDVSRKLEKKMSSAIEASFAAASPSCVVLSHGPRIVGASVLDFDPAADNNLLTGPCILHEYRNRGFGTCLLRASLALLQENEVGTAKGVTRANSISARFIYPKFGSILKPYSIDPLQDERE